MSQTFSLYDIQGTQPQVPAAIHDLFRWACGLPEGQQCGGRKNSDTIQHVQDLREARKQRKKPALRRHSQRKPDDPPSQVCSTLGFKYASTYFFWHPLHSPMIPTPLTTWLRLLQMDSCIRWIPLLRGFNVGLTTSGRRAGSDKFRF